MAQIKRPYEEINIPFAKMSYTPDVPSSALGANEYNIGNNIETDTRGIRSVFGDAEILPAPPGTPIYVTGNFRNDGLFWFVIATLEGRWYATSGATWQEITPNILNNVVSTTGSVNPISGTGPWLIGISGMTTTAGLNIGDSITATPGTGDFGGGAAVVDSIVDGTTITALVTGGTSPTGGTITDITSLIAISGYTRATNFTEAWNGTVLIVNDTLSSPMVWPDYTNAQLFRYSNKLELNFNAVSYPTTGTVRVTYTTAPAVPQFELDNFVRITGTSTAEFNTVWRVIGTTATYVDLDCPVTGIVLGTDNKVSCAYVWNYDPATYTSVTAGFLRMFATPNVGSILVAGNLTYTDINSVTTNFPVTVQWSQSFGLSQAPLTWEPTIANIANQLEVPLRGPAQDAFPMGGQLFICSYWDTVVFSPINYQTTNAPIIGVRPFNQGRGLLNPNCSVNTDKIVYGIDARDIWAFDGSSFVGLGNQRVKNWLYAQIDSDHSDMVYMEVNTQKNQIEIYYPTVAATDGMPNKMLAYRYDLDLWQAPRDVTNAIGTCESPKWHYSGMAWSYDASSRRVIYANGASATELVQKDDGTEFLGNTAIVSEFRRDNIKLSRDYSNKVMVHRLMPEAVNIGQDQLQVANSTGSIDVTLEGANSVGAAASVSTAKTVTLNGNPWAQFDQNAFRVISITLGDTSTTDTWQCTGINWQVTQIEDDR